MVIETKQLLREHHVQTQTHSGSWGGESGSAEGIDAQMEERRGQPEGKWKVMLSAESQGGNSQDFYGVIELELPSAPRSTCSRFFHTKLIPPVHSGPGVWNNTEQLCVRRKVGRVSSL